VEEGKKVVGKVKNVLVVSIIKDMVGPLVCCLCRHSLVDPLVGWACRRPPLGCGRVLIFSRERKYSDLCGGEFF
jgi:hypothetical protein